MAEIFEHGYALVVGVDQNRLSQLALPTVEKDAKAVYDVLVHPERCAYKADNVELLTGEQSTSKNIINALLSLQEKAAADPEATVVVYYSGHGMVDKTTDQYYLVPYDIGGLSRLRADAIKAEALTAEISGIRAKRLLAILDCCHAEGMDVKDVDLAAADHNIDVETRAFPVALPETKGIPEYTAEPGSKDVSDLLDGQGRAILNSSTGAEKSYVRKDGKLSLFTYHLIEALTGHAPHPDDATVVYVTDVMSWVTHEVKKSAAREGRQQTPVMRTSGVFPVAQLIGGQGVAKGIGEMPPDPLAPLPEVAGTTTFNQQGQTVRNQANIGTMHGNIGQIGDNVTMGEQGQYVAGNQVQGDQITTGDISGSSGIAIGRGASAQVTTTTGGGSTDWEAIFAPLQAVAGQQDAALAGKVQALQAQVARGTGADDNQVANLIQDIVDAAPATGSSIVALFARPEVANAAGGATKFVLGRIK